MGPRFFNELVHGFSNFSVLTSVAVSMDRWNPREQTFFVPLWFVRMSRGPRTKCVRSSALGDIVISENGKSEKILSVLF